MQETGKDIEKCAEENKNNEYEQVTWEQIFQKLDRYESTIHDLEEYKTMQKNYVVEPYNMGFYNGVEFALYKLLGREPEYLSAELLQGQEGANTELEKPTTTGTGTVKVKL